MLDVSGYDVRFGELTIRRRKSRIYGVLRDQSQSSAPNAIKSALSCSPQVRRSLTATMLQRCLTSHFSINATALL